jgi:biopolymer transport protein TolR
MAVGVQGNQRGPLVDMNVTPLIDVLLVLLIVFMIITPLTPLGLDALAAAPASTEGDPQTVMVSVSASQQLRVNREPVDIRSLGSRLRDIFSARSERVVLVKGESSLPFAVLAQVIDISKGAGVDKVALITQKVEGADRAQ